MKGTSPSRASGGEAARHRSATTVTQSSFNELEKGKSIAIIRIGVDLGKVSTNRLRRRWSGHEV